MCYIDPTIKSRQKLPNILGISNKRCSEKRSMSCNLYKVAFTGNQLLLMQSQNIFNGRCSCVNFEYNETCEHQKAILGGERNRMRIFEMATRTVSLIHTQNSKINFELFCVPCEAKDEVFVLKVFQRAALSHTFPSFSFVLVDMRESRLHKNVKEPVVCSICPELQQTECFVLMKLLP